MPLPTIPSGNVFSSLPTGFNVDNSCRFNKADGAFLSRTSGTSTDTKKFTISFWIKRCQLGTTQLLFYSGTGGTANGDIDFLAADTFQIYERNASSVVWNLKTNRVFRDTSAWYNIIIAADSTQGTAANRVKMYINGVQETSFATETYPAEDTTFECNASSVLRKISKYVDAATYFGDYYLSEFVFIDGLQLAATSFGEFDEDSPTIWKPIDVSGLTFGDNGFYLDFADSGDLGDDESGNTNDWTETNLAATDQATDTPTNNFCTLNPLAAANNQPTFSEGNCQAVSGGGWYGNLGTFAVSAGKWYWEVKNTSTGGNFHGVIADYVDFDDATVYNEVGATSYSKDDGGEVHYGADTTTADYGSTDQNDILGIALNMDDKQISFYDNGSAIVSNFALDDATNLDFVLPFGFEWNATVQYNFGGCSAFALSSAAQDENGYGNFEYAPPSGYLALCTKNLGSDGG